MPDLGRQHRDDKDDRYEGGGGEGDLHLTDRARRRNHAIKLVAPACCRERHIRCEHERREHQCYWGGCKLPI